MLPLLSAAVYCHCRRSGRFPNHRIDVNAIKKSPTLRRGVTEVRKSVSAMVRTAEADGNSWVPVEQLVYALLPFCVPANRKAIVAVVKEEVTKAVQRRQEAAELMQQRKVKLSASALAELRALFQVR